MVFGPLSQGEAIVSLVLPLVVHTGHISRVGFVVFVTDLVDAEQNVVPGTGTNFMPRLLMKGRSLVARLGSLVPAVEVDGEADGGAALPVGATVVATPSTLIRS